MTSVVRFTSSIVVSFSHFKLLQTLKPSISNADSCEEEIQIYPNEIDPSWGGALRSLIGRN